MSALRLYRWAIAGSVAVLAGCTWTHVLPGPNAVGRDPRYNPEANLETIKSDRIIVGVLPRAGGKVVLCRLHEGHNVLLADPASWAEPKPEAAASANPACPDGRGHGFRLDLPNQAAGQAAPLPGCGRYAVVEKGADRLVLRGPDDQANGIRLTKTVRILPDHRVEVGLTVENLSAKPVTLGAWSNTRLPGTSQAYGTYCEKAQDSLRLEFQGQPETTRMMPYYAASDVFSFAVDTVMRDRQFGYFAKAMLQPERCLTVLAAFTPDTLFIKEAPTEIKPAATPSPAPIAVSQEVPKDKPAGSGILELSFYSLRRTLQPGESMNFVETWTVLPWTGGPNPERQVDFLRHLRPNDFDPIAE